MKHHSRQFEIGFADEAFALVQESGLDADKIQAEAKRREEERKAEAAKQTDLFSV